MYQIIVKLFGHHKKMSKKKLLEFAEIYCGLSKDDIESYGIEETENEVIYTITVRG